MEGMLLGLRVQGKACSCAMGAMKDCCHRLSPCPPCDQWPTSFKMSAQGEDAVSTFRTDQS